MIRRRGALLVGLSLLLGVLAAWGANSWVTGKLTGESGADGLVTVVAAAMAIPYGTKGRKPAPAHGRVAI